MPKSKYKQYNYEHDFHSDPKIRAKAHEYALDIRKFEIELYWKRATYFWVFVGATLGGFVAIQASNTLTTQSKQDISVVLSCLGFVFSVAWLCTNRGSKYWQENWEKHVDMLEDKFTGPLYKVILPRSKPKGCMEKVEHFITGSSPLSVSKINQIISLYVSVLWLALLLYSLPKFSCQADINPFYCGVIFISLLACITFFWLGRTNREDCPNDFSYQATIRTTKINDD